MYYLAKCEDGNTFQVIVDDGEFYVVAYSDMNLRPFKFRQVVEKLTDDVLLAPNAIYRASPEVARYFVRYLDDFGVVQETEVTEMTLYNR